MERTFEEIKAGAKRARQSKYRRDHPERHRNWRKAHPELWLKYRYRCTTEEAKQLLVARQTGVCAICNGNRNDKALCVDHDHTTGALRGLLCSKCNLAFGLMEENPAWLRNMADYADLHTQ